MTDIPTVLLIVVPLVAALVAALVAFLLTRSHFRSRLREKDSEIALMEKYHERSISDMKESWQNSLSSQIDAAKAEMSAESEKVLKMREEQIRAEAKRTFDEISGSLGKDFKEMKDSFESNRISQAASSAALKENLENAVRNLSSRTEEIGRKADNLAEAMRAEVKDEGYSYLLMEYDDDGRLTREEYYDEYDMPANCRAGYAVHSLAYTAEGYIAEESYLNAEGLPFVNADGYSSRTLMGVNEAGEYTMRCINAAVEGAPCFR